MREVREIIKKRLKRRQAEAASAGDRRDWDGSTSADAAVEELQWVLRELENAGGPVKADPTRVFKEPVTFEQSVAFDDDVFVGGNLVVNGTLTCVGFNVS